MHKEVVYRDILSTVNSPLKGKESQKSYLAWTLQDEQEFTRLVRIRSKLPG